MGGWSYACNSLIAKDAGLLLRWQAMFRGSNKAHEPPRQRVLLVLSVSRLFRAKEDDGAEMPEEPAAERISPKAQFQQRMEKAMNEQDLERELQTAKATIQTLYSVFHNVYPRLAEALKGESRYLAKVVDSGKS